MLDIAEMHVSVNGACGCFDSSNLSDNSAFRAGRKIEDRVSVQLIHCLEYGLVVAGIARRVHYS